MPKPSRSLILHIGHHKTGTTAIQNALATGLIEVDGRAPLYPAAMAHNYLTRHFDVYSKTAKLLPPDRQRPNLDQISAALAEGDYQYAVISGEKFSRALPKTTAEVMQKFLLPHVQHHSILCYVRPHAARTLSSYVERVKIGDTDEGSVGDFHRSGPENGRFRFMPRLRAWADVFGPNFIARPFHRDYLKNGSILDDFASHAFARGSIRIHEQKRSNESSCLEDLVLLRFIQSFMKEYQAGLRLQLGWTLTLALDARARGDEPAPNDRGDDDSIMDMIHGLAALISGARGPNKTKVALDRQTAEDIRTTYLKDARILDRTVFAATPLMKRELDHAVDTAIDKPQSMEPSDYCSADRLRQIADLVGDLKSRFDTDERRWAGYFLQRRADDVQKGNVAPAQTPLVDTPAVAPSVSPGVLNAARLDKMISAAFIESDGFAMLSKKLNNTHRMYEAENAHIEPQEIVLRIAQGGPAADVLREYLVTRFFQRNIKDLGASSPGAMPIAGQAAQDLTIIRPALDDRHLSTLDGGIAYIGKDYRAAYSHFDDARRSVIAAGTVRHHNRGLLSMRPLETFQQWARGDFGNLSPAPLTTPDFLSDAPFPTDRPIVMVGMDRGYYNRYAPRLVESAREWTNLHFHIVNPGDEPLLSEPHVRYSVEMAIDPTKGYYASVRFLHLQACLDRYQRPLITADADALFNGSPQPAINFARGSDVAVTTQLNPKPNRAFRMSVPWRMIMAGVFVANPTAGAERFLSAFANIYRGLGADDPTGPHWWVDQALLSIVTDILHPEGIKIAKGWLFRKSGMAQQKLQSGRPGVSASNQVMIVR